MRKIRIKINSLAWSWYDFKHFFINSWKLRKELAQARAWDWTGLLLLMKGQLKQMEESHRLFSYHTTCQNKAKDIRVCIKLLERIIEDDYLKMRTVRNNSNNWLDYKWEFMHDLPRGRKFCIMQPDNLRKQDLELLTNILRRKLFEWWN